MINHQSLLEFVRSNRGREFATDSRGNRFTCTVEDDAIIITRSTGTTKRVTKKRINLFCDRFNATKSFVAIDYHRDLTAAASQLLLLTRLMLESPCADKRHVGSARATKAESRFPWVVPLPDDLDAAQSLVEGAEYPDSAKAYQRDPHAGQLWIAKNGMDFQYDASDVNECAPLLYLWTIHDTTDRIWYCYVGKANGGADRPRKSYTSVVKRLQRGRPYRPNNPTYRVVHQRMAEAVEKGFTIRLQLIRNVPPPRGHIHCRG